MRILHTSDWHLGKRLIDRERLPEQIEALEELTSICERENVDVVLVAGDIFDTYLPPAEAEEVFYHAVKKLAGEDRAVVIVSGNHDDGVRLAAAAPLAAEEGIYLFGGHAAIRPNDRPVGVAEAGENYLILRDRTGEKLYINALPYPNEARLKEEKTEETYGERVARWIAKGDEHYDGTMPHILLSHLFVAGGEVTSGERDVSLGGARSVPVSCLPSFGYTALGHLHKRQKVGDRGRYSGSLLRYSFDEAGSEKAVVLLETRGTEVCVEREIPIRGGKPLARLEANDLGSALGLLEKERDSYIELTLHLKHPLTAAEHEQLRTANPGLLSLSVAVEGEEAMLPESRSALSAGELFAEYCRVQCGKEPSDEIMELFLSLVEEGS